MMKGTEEQVARSSYDPSYIRNLYLSRMFTRTHGYFPQDYNGQGALKMADAVQTDTFISIPS